jgi:hypothetical protein
MTDKSKKLSETARALLTAASARDDHLIQPPHLPAAAARQVVRSLLNAGLAEEVSAVVDDGDGDGCPSATRSAAVTIVAGADSAMGPGRRSNLSQPMR